MPARSAPLPRLAVIALTSWLLAGCATTGPKDPADPWQPMNRGVYSFNVAVDKATLKPAAKVYRDQVPKLVRTGVGNFFTNLSVPATALNDLLQGKPVAASQDLLRFVINTTLGWGGIFDIATPSGVPIHQEDLGQTLGKWGVPAGPYVMVPLLGPSTVRDLPSAVVDRLLEPLYWFNPGNARWISLGLSAVDTRANLLPLDKSLAKTYDPYAFVRNAYLQRREFLIYDGNPPEQPLDEELLEDESPDESGDAAPPATDPEPAPVPADEPPPGT
ncbi:MAG: VacJ family lipoprotein [Steroidobacteraceae bacterium]